MPWPFSVRQRKQALDEKVDAVSSRVEEIASRLVHLSADLGRLSSDVDQVRHRLDANASDRRDQADQLLAVRDAIAELQASKQKTLEVVADLEADGKTASDVMARQASLLSSFQENTLQQSRSLDQIRADVTRIERQAAVDLAEVRTTNLAIAQMVINARRTPNSCP